MSTDNLSGALDKLAHFRARNLRRSQEVLDAGVLVLKKNALGSMGDDAWAFLEQLALAALDVGRVDVADTCLQRLTGQFPGSPRVEVLAGIRIEATQSPEIALKYYEELLEADPTNVAAWKRQISVYRRTGDVERAVKELTQLLDTFYTDPEGWLELADIYSSCSQHTYALQALQHAILLVPQNSFYVLLGAEAAYRAIDIPLASQMFLQVIDMADDGHDSATPPLSALTVRAWYGLRLALDRLTKDTKSASISPSKTVPPTHTQVLHQLADERYKSATAAQRQQLADEIPRAWAEEAEKWQNERV